jgi:hypothetical protein
MEDTTYTSEEIKRMLQSLKTKDFLNVVSDVVVDGVANPQQLRASIEALRSEVNKKAYQQLDIPLKPRFDTTMLHDALSYQLENEVAPKEVYMYVQEVYNKDDDWMKDAKHAELPQKERSAVAKQIAKQEIPVTFKVGDLGLSIGTLIRSSETPSKAIRGVDSYIELANRVDKLESQVSNLDIRQTTTEVKLQCLVDNLNVDIDENKVVASLLKKKGFTQRQISSELGVHEKTVSRWFKEIRKDLPHLLI